LVIATEKVCDVCEADTEFLVNISVQRVYYLQRKMYVLVFKLVTIIFLTIFGPKTDEVTREWRKLHNEELNDLYSPPNIVLVIRSKRMKWAGHVARFREREVYTGFWWGELGERENLEDSGVDGRMILRGIFRKWDVRAWTGSSWLRIGIGGGHL
jgi:hypothetical protein